MNMSRLACPPTVSGMLGVALLTAVAVRSSVGADTSWQHEHVVAELAKLSRAKGVEDYVAASNALHRLGTIALPILIEIARTNRPAMTEHAFFPSAEFMEAPIPVDELSLQVSLACRVLGRRAAPVLRELSDRLSIFDSRGSYQAQIAFHTLINIGLPGLRQAIESSVSGNPIAVSLFDYPICRAVSDSPRRYLPALIGVYEHGDPRMRERVKPLLQKVFLNDDFDVPSADALAQILSPHLESPDPFIRSQILVYFGVKGTNMVRALPYVAKKLMDTDPSVRLAATNALRAITAPN